MGIWKKIDIGINYKKFLLILVCPQFIYGCSFDFFGLCPHQKDVLPIL